VANPRHIGCDRTGCRAEPRAMLREITVET